MSIGTQDWVKGLDMTGQPSVSASELNQLADLSVPAADRFIGITSTDTALDTPDVPDANAVARYKRFLWKRTFFTATTPPVIYQWHDGLADSDPTLLKWVPVNESITSTSGYFFKNTLSSLRALPSLSTNKMAILLGIASAFEADFRPRIYVWNPTYAGADTAGSYIRSTDGGLGGWYQVL